MTETRINSIRLTTNSEIDSAVISVFAALGHPSTDLVEYLSTIARIWLGNSMAFEGQNLEEVCRAHEDLICQIFADPSSISLEEELRDLIRDAEEENIIREPLEKSVPIIVDLMRDLDLPRPEIFVGDEGGFHLTWETPDCWDLDLVFGPHIYGVNSSPKTDDWNEFVVSWSELELLKEKIKLLFDNSGWHLPISNLSEVKTRFEKDSVKWDFTGSGVSLLLHHDITSYDVAYFWAELRISEKHRSLNTNLLNASGVWPMMGKLL